MRDFGNSKREVQKMVPNKVPRNQEYISRPFQHSFNFQDGFKTFGICEILEIPREFQRGFQGKFQSGSKEGSKESRRYFKTVSGQFQDGFKTVSRLFQDGFKTILGR